MPSKIVDRLVCSSPVAWLPRPHTTNSANCLFRLIIAARIVGHALISAFLPVCVSRPKIANFSKSKFKVCPNFWLQFRPLARHLVYHKSARFSWWISLLKCRISWTKTLSPIRRLVCTVSISRSAWNSLFWKQFILHQTHHQFCLELLSSSSAPLFFTENFLAAFKHTKFASLACHLADGNFPCCHRLRRISEKFARRPGVSQVPTWSLTAPLWRKFYRTPSSSITTPTSPFKNSNAFLFLFVEWITLNQFHLFCLKIIQFTSKLSV